MEGNIHKKKGSHLEKDVSVLTKDVGVLKTNVKAIKTDVKVLKQDVGEIKVTLTEHEKVQTKMALAITILQADMEEVKETMVKKNDFDQLQKGQDEMIKILLRVDQERMATNARMDRFEEALKIRT